MSGRALYVIVCAAAAVVPLLPARGGASASHVAFPGWPARFEGRSLRARAASDVERRFAADFPGRIARFTDGSREIVMRWVVGETRKLHPAGDCFRGIGYAVRPLPLWMDAERRRWGCFEATRGGERLRVRERIFDGDGNAWADTSAWYWAALLGKSRGPWWAVTVIEHESSGLGGDGFLDDGAP